MSQESYWAQGRTCDVMARAIDYSLSVGLYAPDGSQAGYARLVTDWATFAWLCDVFVDAAHRGQGLGSFLVAQAVGHPDVADIRQVLMAKPGRTIYRRLRIRRPAERRALDGASRQLARPAWGSAGGQGCPLAGAGSVRAASR